MKAVNNALIALVGGIRIPPSITEADDPDFETINAERNAQRAAIAECPARIIRFLELQGGVNLLGFGGTNPQVLFDYFRSLDGYDAAISYLPNNIDNRIREACASIFLYHGGSLYLHYVMIRHCTVSGQFYIYNWRGFGLHSKASVESWLTDDYGGREVNLRPLALITINRR